jgi:signal transduction histidine kinase
VKTVRRITTELRPVVLDYLASGAMPRKMLKSSSGRNRLIVSDKGVNQYLKAY